MSSYALVDQIGQRMTCHIHCTGKVLSLCVSSYALVDQIGQRMTCHIHCTGVTSNRVKDVLITYQRKENETVLDL